MICPPGGRLIEVRYANGDQFRAELFNAAGVDDFVARYPNWGGGGADALSFPLTVAELSETAAGTLIEFGPNHSRIGGNMISESFMSNCRAGIVMALPSGAEDALFPAMPEAGTADNEA